MHSSNCSLYNPVAPIDTPEATLLAGLESLQGKVVGFIDNAKPNFQLLVEDLSEQLTKHYGVKKVITHRKPGQVPVKPEVLAQMVSECDAVITGSGD
jgi:hypothetical protein